MSECPERTFSSVFVALRYKDPRTKQAITLYPGEEKTLAKSPSKVFVAINAALGGNIYPPETDLMLKSCNVAMNSDVNVIGRGIAHLKRLKQTRYLVKKNER